MKAKLLAFFALAVACSGHAQGTMQFVARLTSMQTDFTGYGQFMLTGNMFTYDVTSPYGYDSGVIQMGGMGFAIFNLNLRFPFCRAPEPFPGTNGGGCYFGGNLILSEGQVSELLSGQWYVRTYFGEGEGVYGQITVVPEPSWSQLFGVSFGLALLYRMLARRRVPATQRPAPALRKGSEI